MSSVPTNLSDRGSALWSALGREVGTAAGELALEACRLADRLDGLDRMLRRGDWFEMVERPEGSDRFVVVIDSAVAEARQGALALKVLLEKLGLEDKATPSPSEVSPLAAVLDLVRAGSDSTG